MKKVEKSYLKRKRKELNSVLKWCRKQNGKHLIVAG